MKEEIRNIVNAIAGYRIIFDPNDREAVLQGSKGCEGYTIHPFNDESRIHIPLEDVVFVHEWDGIHLVKGNAIESEHCLFAFDSRQANLVDWGRSTTF